VLKGDGKGGFTPLSALQSGIFINGNGKALAKLASAGGNYLLVATQNQGPVQVYKNKQSGKIIRAAPGDVYAEFTFQDEKKQKAECYYGASFLSQSSRFFSVPGNVKSCSITDVNGKTRIVF
jgi:hypothetical protein